MAINRYIYIILNYNYNDNLILKYSKYEVVKNVKQIKHNLIKRIFLKYNIKSHIEMSSFADLPAQSGLGSSGSFSVALIGALNKFYKNKINIKKIVHEAYLMETESENYNVGYQDHYIAGYGGVSEFKSKNSIDIKHYNFKISKDTLSKIEKSFFLINTKIERKAASVLINQNINLEKNKDKLNNYLNIYDLASKMKYELLDGNLHNYSLLNRKHWENKISKGSFMSDKSIIDQIENYLSKNIFHSGKLIGAGYGGYILGISFNTKRTTKYLNDNGINFFKIKASDGIKIYNH